MGAPAAAAMSIYNVCVRCAVLEQLRGRRARKARLEAGLKLRNSYALYRLGFIYLHNVITVFWNLQLVVDCIRLEVQDRLQVSDTAMRRASDALALNSACVP